MGVFALLIRLLGFKIPNPNNMDLKSILSLLKIADFEKLWIYRVLNDTRFHAAGAKNWLRSPRNIYWGYCFS